MAGYQYPEQECMMSYFHTPGARAILGDDGEPVGLFGLGAKAWVEQLRRDRVEASNWAFSANATGIRWLISLGFRVHKPEPRGPYKMLFRYFHL
jgi:hypothetical protein